MTQNSVAATFAYNVALSNTGWRVSAGINGGMKSFTYNPDGYTENLLHSDDNTLLSYMNQNVVQFSAGLWLYNDRFFAGASSLQMFNADQKSFQQGEGMTPGSTFLRHYFYTMGIKANLSLDIFLVPSVLVKTVEGAPVSFDLNAKMVVSNKYWLGGSYRREDSFALFGGLLIKNRLELTYSFDLILSKIRNGTAGSSEIHIGYRLFHHPEVVCPSKFW